MRVRVSMLFLSFVLLLATLGLAVPNINVSVQGIGSGSCVVLSPANRANIAVEWNVTDRSLPFRPRYDFVLSRINITFSDTLPSGSYIYLNMTIYGYNRNTRQYQYDTFVYTDTLNYELNAGDIYSIINTDTTYTYRVTNTRPKPAVVRLTLLVMDGYHVCTSYKITLNVQEIGIGNLNSVPPGNQVGAVNITVTERKGQPLTDYVINFTLSGDWSGTYPYLYDTAENRRLYYWYIYDPESKKTWFWVKVNLSSGQTKLLKLYYGNQSAYPPEYNDPTKVFWYYNSTLLVMNPGDFYLVGNFADEVSYYRVDGYVLITRARIGSPENRNEHGPAYFVFNGTYGLLISENVYYGEVIRLRNSYRRRIVRWHYETGSFSYTGGSAARGIVFDRYLIYQLAVNGNDFTTQTWQNGTLLWTRDFYNDVSFILDSLEGFSPLYLAQLDSGTSYYSWRAVRPYVSPEPSVELSGTGGEWIGDKYVERFVIYLSP